MDQDIKLPKIPKDQNPSRRPSEDKVREDADKWALSRGLQPPTYP